MTEDLKFVCPKCKSKKTHRIITGGTGYIMANGATSRGTVASRHGHKKKWSTPTPAESARAKASAKQSEAVGHRELGADPYAAFRTKK
jgi:hypothetical protein